MIYMGIFKIIDNQPMIAEGETTEAETKDNNNNELNP